MEGLRREEGKLATCMAWEVLALGYKTLVCCFGGKLGSGQTASRQERLRGEKVSSEKQKLRREAMWQARRDTENHESGDGGGWSVWPQELALLSAPTSFKPACRLNLTQSFFQETNVVLKEQFTKKMICSPSCRFKRVYCSFYFFKGESSRRRVHTMTAQSS